jgi:four helix bundle protein
MPNKNVDIHEKVYKFVLQVLKLLSSLPKSELNLIIIRQCARSVTSVGANDQEADASGSRRDFIAKYSITKKELKETNYWLRLIGDTNLALKSRASSLGEEGRELLLIIGTIIKKAKVKK